MLLARKKLVYKLATGNLWRQYAHGRGTCTCTYSWRPREKQLTATKMHRIWAIIAACVSCCVTILLHADARTIELALFKCANKNILLYFNWRWFYKNAIATCRSLLLQIVLNIIQLTQHYSIFFIINWHCNSILSSYWHYTIIILTLWHYTIIILTLWHYTVIILTLTLYHHHTDTILASYWPCDTILSSFWH